MPYFRVVLGLVVMTALACTGGDQGDLIAIDVLLQPGPTMVAEAEALNARLREQMPEGFALDEQHVPHITLVQRYVAPSDLPKVLAAVDEVRRSHDFAQLEMRATGLYHPEWGGVGLEALAIEPSEELLALQQAVIEAVTPFAKSGGGESAFVPDTSGTPFEQTLFGYVDTFVPDQTGENFNPHVTVGIGPLDWLDELEQQPFAEFTFGAVGIATYQLGNFGTAAKRLDEGS
jgi:hypothetical protein